uniref:Uncharacterized protein n=1 Tax=Plectus sambesii TaxID=2011161 RepID=A0A914XGP6_9BILA
MDKLSSLCVFFVLLQTTLTVLSAPVDTFPFQTRSNTEERTAEDWENDMLTMRTLFGKRDSTNDQLQMARRSAEEKLLNDLEGLIAQQNTKGKPLRFSFKG